MTLNFYTTTSCPNVVENKMFSVFFPVMDDMGKFKSTTTLCTPWTTLAFARLTDSNASACQDIQPSAATPSNLITPHPPPTLCLLWKWISNTKIALKSAASPAGRFWQTLPTLAGSEMEWAPNGKGERWWHQHAYGPEAGSGSRVCPRGEKELQTEQSSRSCFLCLALGSSESLCTRGTHRRLLARHTLHAGHAKCTSNTMQNAKRRETNTQQGDWRGAK